MRVDDELAAFCEAERPRLVGLLALYLGDVQAAEELAQDALVRLCQHWPRVRSMTHQRAWLTQVAMNLARSWFRRRMAGWRATVRHGHGEQSVARDDATVLAVRSAVSALPRRMREAVVLRHFEGYSVRETAELMGCAEGTVKSLTAKAFTHLRAAGLEPDDPTSDPRTEIAPRIRTRSTSHEAR